VLTVTAPGVDQRYMIRYDMIRYDIHDGIIVTMMIIIICLYGITVIGYGIYGIHGIYDMG
jgi:hypothetical protein